MLCLMVNSKVFCARLWFYGRVIKSVWYAANPLYQLPALSEIPPDCTSRILPPTTSPSSLFHLLPWRLLHAGCFLWWLVLRLHTQCVCKSAMHYLIRDQHTCPTLWFYSPQWVERDLRSCFASNRFTGPGWMGQSETLVGFSNKKQIKSRLMIGWASGHWPIGQLDVILIQFGPRRNNWKLLMQYGTSSDYM